MGYDKEHPMGCDKEHPMGYDKEPLKEPLWGMIRSILWDMIAIAAPNSQQEHSTAT